VARSFGLLDEGPHPMSCHGCVLAYVLGDCRGAQLSSVSAASLRGPQLSL
jgi:hypothetical protein